MLSEKEFYEKLLEALDALPAKRLGDGNYWDDENECACALGAYMLHRLYDPRETSLSQLNEDEVPDTRTWDKVAYANDDFKGAPEARWAYMREWVKEKLDAQG